MTSEHIQCIGCGATIQSHDVNGIGYVPQSALLKNHALDNVYCQRCFKLRHYNQIEKVAISDSQFLNMLHAIGDEKALIVNVIDIFDVYGTLISGLPRLVGNNPILIVANKIDLLPKSVNLKRVTFWLKKQLKEQGIVPIDIILASGHKKREIDNILSAIERYRQKQNVYVVGVTNVGKSTLINSIISSLGGEKQLITTSQFPGTTLDNIKIPFEDGAYLIDTPGIIHRHQMAHYLDDKSLKLVSPQKELRPITFQLNPEQTLFLGGLGRFDYISGERNSVTCYFSQALHLHRTKLSGADAFYQKHIGGLLTPMPIEQTNLKRVEFQVTGNSDIVISGLGWITIHQKGKVAIYTPHGVDVTIREAII